MTHGTAGERAELASMDGMDGIAPPVRAVPCGEHRIDHASAWAVCEACGWLEDDHAAHDHPGAVVTELPRRRAPLPERKAS